MTDFTLHDQITAPDDSKPLLAKSYAAFGMFPGLHAVMAEAPGLPEACQPVHGPVVNSGFGNAEMTVVWQSINVENACHYCVPAHTAVARGRGNAAQGTVETFLDAGFTKRRILKGVLGYSQKVMSNYTNHLANTPVDKPFQKFAWRATT